jgi:hypothetical protein
MAHDEFPKLEDEAADVLRDAEYNLDMTKPYWKRRYLAAGLREAMKQAGSSIWKDNLNALIRITNNLHALPSPLPSPLLSPPPTREQMEIALGRLLRHTNDPAGCHEGSLIAELANVLRRGIAHHCKEQP